MPKSKWSIPVIFLMGILTGCTMHKLTNYPMGDGRFNISARGNSFIDQEGLKKEWYKEANKLCSEGFLVEKIEEKRKILSGYPKPGLEGVIKCK